jgi:hypothetical protein
MDSQTGQVTQSFFAFDPIFTGDVYLPLINLNQEGSLNIHAGSG